WRSAPPVARLNRSSPPPTGWCALPRGLGSRPPYPSPSRRRKSWSCRGQFRSHGPSDSPWLGRFSGRNPVRPHPIALHLCRPIGAVALVRLGPAAGRTGRARRLGLGHEHHRGSEQSLPDEVTLLELAHHRARGMLVGLELLHRLVQLRV